MELWDTAGQEDYDRLRPLSYPGTHVFLGFFSIGDPATLERLKDSFCPEISQHCPDVPLVLVGTQLGLRDDAETVEKLALKNLKPVSYEEGLEMMQKNWCGEIYDGLLNDPIIIKLYGY